MAAPRRTRPHHNLASAAALVVLFVGFALQTTRSARAKAASGAIQGRCDLTQGRWVYTGSAALRYNTTPGSPSFCPFASSAWSCGAVRPDTDYAKYQWTPEGCRLPLLDPMGFATLMRGKRMLVAGDSVMANFFEALVCLLSSNKILRIREVAVGQELPVVSRAAMRGYRFEEYDFELHYLESMFLAQAVPRVTTLLGAPVPGYTVDCDEVDPALVASLPRYQVALLSSGTSWQQKVLGSNQYRVSGNVTTLNDLTAHGYSLWALRRHLSQSRYQGIPYFLSVSPWHDSGAWHDKGACGSRSPVDMTFVTETEVSAASSFFAIEAASIQGSTLRFMPITGLSARRPDAHPGFWSAGKVFQALDAKVNGAGDCIHWCLPGVPDTWADILFASLRIELRS